MRTRIDRRGIGLLLIALGTGFLVVLFAIAVQGYYTYRVEARVESGGNESLTEVLVENSFVVLDVFVKIAFLALAVWVASILLRSGIDALRRGEGAG